MKIPDIFIPERDLEKKVKRLLQGEQTWMIHPTGVMIDEDIFKDDDIFKELGQVILDHVIDQNDREKYFKELKTAKVRYREEIKKMFDVDINYQRIS